MAEFDKYYATCPFPKPVDRKKKKKCNGYKNKAERYCYYCGTPYAERHEVFPGINRQISIDEGFQVDLCTSCHQEIQANITERAQERNDYWRKLYQRNWMDKLIKTGITEDKALAMWMALIGKNYLEECNPL